MTQSSVDDPVEIIRLHHMEPLKLPRSFRVDAAYTQLDAEGVDRLITLAIERFEEDDEAIVSCLYVHRCPARSLAHRAACGARHSADRVPPCRRSLRRRDHRLPP